MLQQTVFFWYKRTQYRETKGPKQIHDMQNRKQNDTCKFNITYDNTMYDCNEWYNMRVKVFKLDLKKRVIQVYFFYRRHHFKFRHKEVELKQQKDIFCTLYLQNNCNIYAILNKINVFQKIKFDVLYWSKSYSTYEERPPFESYRYVLMNLRRQK